MPESERSELPDTIHYAIALVTLAEDNTPTVVDTFPLSPWVQAHVLKLAMETVTKQLTHRQERVQSLQNIAGPAAIITLAQDLVDQSQAHVDKLLPAMEATEHHCRLWDAILTSPAELDCDDEGDIDAA